VLLAGDGSLKNVLAQEVTSDASLTKWTIKLKPNVKWHDGKPFTADDVIYCIRVTLQAKPFVAFNSNGYTGIKASSVRKVDDTTLSFELESPNSQFLGQLAENYNQMFQQGVTKFDKPIGTGPFAFVSWTIGERALYKRFDEYHDKPAYFDTLEIISIVDPAARLNALVSGQVDAIASPSIAQIPTIKANSNLQLIENPGGTANSICMQCTPHKGNVGSASSLTNNVLVRQALRLLVDREQIVKSVWGGHAKLGNDLHNWADPNYNSDLPQRTYDPEKAKALLKQAGVSGDLKSVGFVYSDLDQGALSTCTLFASSAAKSGATLGTKIVPSADYFGKYWMKYPMGIDYWRERAMANGMRIGFLPGAAFNETNMNNPTFNKVYADLCKAKSESLQKDLLFEAQKILYEEGGYVIPAFGNFVVAANKKVINIPQGAGGEFDQWSFAGISFKA
jgi:peptide/nickel transport system substrate-binding protein